jgi:hypothetical protein
MHQQALNKHQTPTAIFDRIQKPFYFIKISHKILSWHLVTFITTLSKN